VSLDSLVEVEQRIWKPFQVN